MSFYILRYYEFSVVNINALEHFLQCQTYALFQPYTHSRDLENKLIIINLFFFFFTFMELCKSICFILRSFCKDVLE